MHSQASSCLSSISSTTSSTTSSTQSSLQQEQEQQQQYDEEYQMHSVPLTAVEGGDEEDECECDSYSLASDVPSLDRSSSVSSDGSSHQDHVSPLGGMLPRLKPRLLRQRNSGLSNESSSSVQHQLQPSDSADMASSPAASLLRTNANNASSASAVVPAVAVDFIPQFLLPQNMSAPIPRGPVRKHSDFEQGPYNKGLDQYQPPGGGKGYAAVAPDGKYYLEEPEPADLGSGNRFRRRDEIVLHFMVELNMLWRDSLVIGLGLLFQWFHSIFTNLAYYYHTHLTAAQRVPLKDIAYEALPLLAGKWWMVSEYLVLVMIIVIIISISSILVIRWNPPHGRPLYCIPILRRMCMTLTVCQILRCISFLVTTLPGASRQCLYDVPHDMSREEMMHLPAHDRGNPSGWAPPITMNDILFRVDATNGCGDLMFSSHTIFTMLFVCVIWRYFNWGFLKWGMLTMQMIIVPFILAARKHYSVDVFTALYVTPLVFEVFKLKFRDLDIISSDMAKHYGVRFRRSYEVDEQDGMQKPRYIMSMRGGEYYVELADIPLDLQKVYEASDQRNDCYSYGLQYPSCGGGGAGDNDLDLYEEELGDLSDYEPAIV